MGRGDTGMRWYYCPDCNEIFAEDEIGSKPESWKGEAWGAIFIQTDFYDCCPKCGEEIEEVSECACGKTGLKPNERVCENCLDDLSYIVGKLRELYPDIKEADKSTVLEVIADSW
jgi:hypothetical protein